MEIFLWQFSMHEYLQFSNNSEAGKQQPQFVGELLFHQPDHPAFIAPEARVIEVGLGAWQINQDLLLPMSPGPLMFPPYVANLGAYDIIDLPGKGDSRGGFRDVVGVVNQIGTLFEVAQMPIYTPIIMLADFLQLETHSTYDVAFDHLTSFDWLLSQENPLHDVPIAQHIGRQYRQLVPQGKVLIYTRDLGDYNLRQLRKLTHGFLQAGFSLQSRDRIFDLYKLPTLITDLIKHLAVAKIRAFNQDGYYFPAYRASRLLVFTSANCSTETE